MWSLGQPVTRWVTDVGSLGSSGPEGVELLVLWWCCSSLEERPLCSPADVVSQVHVRDESTCTVSLRGRRVDMGSFCSDVAAHVYVRLDVRVLFLGTMFRTFLWRACRSFPFVSMRMGISVFMYDKTGWLLRVLWSFFDLCLIFVWSWFGWISECLRFIFRGGRCLEGPRRWLWRDCFKSWGLRPPLSVRL